jgi:transposase
MTGTTSGLVDGGNRGAAKETHRQYTLDLKRRIVEETFVPGASVSVVARRHNVNSNLVFNWRKRYREGTLGGSMPTSKAISSAGQDLIRIGVIDPSAVVRPVPLVGGSSSVRSPAVPGAKDGVVKDHASLMGPSVIDIELPNRVKLRVSSSVEEEALRLVLAVSRQLP